MVKTESKILREITEAIRSHDQQILALAVAVEKFADRLMSRREGGRRKKTRTVENKRVGAA